MLRRLLSLLLPAPATAAERLALAFALHPDAVKPVLDALRDDEARAEFVLLYAARQNLHPLAALDELFLATLDDRTGIDAWAGTFDGQQTLLAWRAFEPLPARVRLWATVRCAAPVSQALMKDFKRNFAKARAAILRT